MGASLAAVAALCTVVGAATKKRTHAVAVSANHSAATAEDWQRRRAAHAAATAPPAAASAAAPGVNSSVEHGPSTLSVSLVPAPSATGSGKQRRLAYTDAEDEHIWNHVAENGPCNWSALQLPGRAASSVRNRWVMPTGQLLLEKTRLMGARNACATQTREPEATAETARRARSRQSTMMDMSHLSGREGPTSIAVWCRHVSRTRG